MRRGGNYLVFLEIEEISVAPGLSSFANRFLKEQSLPYVDVTLEKLENELKLGGYSFETRKAYLGHVGRFIRFFGKNIRRNWGKTKLGNIC